MTRQPLNVTIDMLPERRVAFLIYQTEQAVGDFDLAIRATFDRVKAQIREIGVDVGSLPAIGIAHVVDGQLHAYECCIPIADTLPIRENGEIGSKALPGGKYAILEIEKQSSIIGETIGRFFQEYVPGAHLQIDSSRPTYEVYWDKTLDFCVPVQE